MGRHTTERSLDMAAGELNVVIGAYGYTGRFITKILLEKGIKVRTLTNHPNRPHPFGNRVEAKPYHFDEPGLMA
jgi:NADH dehydrogenase